jgi:hypothetical protein
MSDTSARHARRIEQPVSEWPLWLTWRLVAPLVAVTTILAPAAANIGHRSGAAYLVAITAVVTLAVLSGLVDH